MILDMDEYNDVTCYYTENGWVREVGSRLQAHWHRKIPVNLYKITGDFKSIFCYASAYFLLLSEYDAACCFSCPLIMRDLTIRTYSHAFLVFSTLL